MIGNATTIEITEFAVDPSDHASFDDAVRAALPILERQPGVISIRFGKIVEPAQGFLLVVEWRRLSDHVDLFRASPDFDAFVSYFRPLLQRPSRVLHLPAGVDQSGLRHL